MASRDRRVLERFLVEYFPEMAGKSSDEWHDFLNKETGLSVPRDAWNAAALDEWRKALAEKGRPILGDG